MSAYNKRHDAWLVDRARAEDTAFQERALSLESRNPAANRDLERRELRRAVIEMLLGYPQFENVFKDSAVTPGAGDPPRIQGSVVAAERDTLTFMEQAFDWRNMSWVLYPYYWQDKANWAGDAIMDAGADPEHTAFQTAGAARVVVPARVGFEDAVNFFLASGIIWSGSDVPTVDDSAYLAIQEEIADALGAGPGPTQRQALDPIRLPTTLIWLQADGVLA